MLLTLAPEGTLSVVADRFEELRGVTSDAAGTFYAAARGRKGADEKRKGTIFRIHLPDGTVSRAIAANFKDPVDLKFDAVGTLFFTAKKFEPGAERDADEHEKKNDAAGTREARLVGHRGIMACWPAGARDEVDRARFGRVVGSRGRRRVR